MENPTELDLHSIYGRWLAHQTRTWRTAWAGNWEAIREFLEPARIAPLDCGSWHDHATWELVREAVRQHDALSRHLDAWEWPSCQADWLRWGGPTWDAYGWAFATQARHPALWTSIFTEVLHHPIRPGLAWWAYGAWKVAPPRARGSLSDLSPISAMDTVLREIPPDSPAMVGEWKQAWQDWVDADPPAPDEPLPGIRYPTRLVTSWQATLVKTLDKDPGPPIRSSQMRWF